MEDLLKKLGETYKDRLFSQNAIAKDLSLDHAKQQTVIHQINALKNQPPKNGLRIKSVASGNFKVIRAEPSEADPIKDLPLPPAKEALTGEISDPASPESAERLTNSTESSEKPHFLPTVPAELKALPQWVLWKSEVRDSEPTKIPKQSNGRNAKSNEPSTWTDYPSVCKVRDRLDGLGFVFSSSAPYCGIDLDKCLDVSGELKAWAMSIVDRLKAVAYGEVSPSGKGIKFWTKARLPILAKHKVYLDETTGEAIEAYDSGRYFTVTGKGRGTIKEGQQAIDWLVQEYLTTTPRPTQNLDRNPSADTSLDESSSEVLNEPRCHRRSSSLVIVSSDLTSNSY